MKIYQTTLMLFAAVGAGMAGESLLTAPAAPAAPLTITATDALGHVHTGTATWTSMDYNANAITIAYKHDTLTCNGFEP